MTLLHITDAVTLVSDTIHHSNIDTSGIIDVLMQINNSVDSITPLLEKTVKNTHPEPWTVRSLIIAVLSAFFTLGGLFFSYLTATNVKRVNSKTQEMLFIDIVRHLYRNEICTLAMITNMRINPNKYPSDEHILKLKTLPEDIHLDRYNNNHRHYAKMHELSLLLRNYNTEIEIVYKYLEDPKSDKIVLEKGFETLLFKPFYLINRIIDVMSEIEKKKDNNENRKKIIQIVLSEHINKFVENYDSQKLNGYKREEITPIIQSLNIQKIQKQIIELTKSDQDKGAITINSGLILNKKNDFLKKGTKVYIDNTLPNKLKAMISKKIGDKDLFNMNWNSFYAIHKGLLIDGIIELDKINMIDYPQLKKEIETTDEEIEGSIIIKSLLRNKVDLSRIVFRDTKKYFGIMLDNNKKTICRLYFNGEKKYITTMTENKKELRFDIDELDDIYKYENEILNSLGIYLEE